MESYQEKLAWAREHLDALDRDIAAFVNTDAYGIDRKFDPETCRVEFRFVVCKPFPREWGLRVGDIVHNMRSGLDALVYELALRNSGEPTEAQATDLQFLICDTEGEFFGRCRRRHGRMSLAAQEGIAFVQPFRRPRAGSKNELAVLRDLSNVDKHRHLLPCFASAHRGRITVRIPNALPNRLPIRGRLEHGTILGSVVLPRGVDPLLDVVYESNLTLDVAFEERKAGFTGICAVLRLIDTYIQDVVLAEMEQYLE